MRNCRQTLFEWPSHRRISKHISRFCTFGYTGTQTICGMNISRPACIGSTVEASKVRKNRKIFAFKKFILPNCLDSATPPTPNEHDPNSRAVKMYRKEEEKRRGKGKGKEEKFGVLIKKKKKKKRNKSVSIDFSMVTPAPSPFMSRTWTAYTRRKPVISTFVYGLDIIDQLYRRVSKRKYQTPPPFLQWFSKPLAVERISMHIQNLVKFHQFVLKILSRNLVGMTDNLGTVYPHTLYVGRIIMRPKDADWMSVLQ